MTDAPAASAPAPPQDLRFDEAAPGTRPGPDLHGGAQSLDHARFDGPHDGPATHAAEAADGASIAHRALRGAESGAEIARAGG